MFIDAGHNIRIYCDYSNRRLRVQTNVMPAPWLPHWSECTFENEEDWGGSPFKSWVTDEDVGLAIQWFWHDLNSETPTV
jgi:hypothetical protein